MQLHEIVYQPYPSPAYLAHLALVIIGICAVALGVAVIYRGIWRD